MHQCSKNAKLGKIVELGGEATCMYCNQVREMTGSLLHLTNNVYDVYDMLCMFMKFTEP